MGTENICIEHFEALGVISDPVTTKILPERKFPRSVSETVTQEKPEVSKSGVGCVLRGIPVFLDRLALLLMSKKQLETSSHNLGTENGIQIPLSS